MDSGSMITYEEVDVDEDELTGRRRSSKKRRKTSYPLYFILSFALSILIFVTYYVLELHSNSTRGFFV